MVIKHVSPLFVVFLLLGCAQVKAPVGGPKDVEPPALVSSSPSNGELEFKDNKVVLEFDEYLVLKDQSQILLSPAIEGDLEVQALGKSIEVTLPGELADSTTYQLYFGNAIADFREQNALEDFGIAWSTTSELDTLVLKGKVVAGAWREPQVNWLVGAFAPGEDWLRSNPLRLARTAKTGDFQLLNLGEKNYHLAAWEDGNKNNKWDGPNEKLAFTFDQFTPLQDSTSITLAGQAQLDSVGIVQYGMEAERRIVVHNNPEFLCSLNWTDKPFIAEEFAGDSSVYWVNPTFALDSIWAISSRQDTLRFQFAGFKKEARLVVESNFTSPNPMLEAPFLLFSEPVSPDSLVAKYQQDSTFLEFDWNWKPMDKSLRKWSFSVPDTLTKGEILIEDSAIASFYNSPVKAATFPFVQADESKYGKFILVLDTVHHGFAEFWLKDKLIYRAETLEKTLTTPFMLPGNYKIRWINDVNGNGKWDGPQYLFNTEGEELQVYPSEVQLRANWDKEIEWVLDRRKL